MYISFKHDPNIVFENKQLTGRDPQCLVPFYAELWHTDSLYQNIDLASLSMYVEGKKFS